MSIERYCFKLKDKKHFSFSFPSNRAVTSDIEERETENDGLDSHQDGGDSHHNENCTTVFENYSKCRI